MFKMPSFKWQLLSVVLLFSVAACSKPSTPSPTPTPPPNPPAPAVNEVDFWLTKGDKSALLEKQSTILSFGTVANAFPVINVDSAAVFQQIDGFGYTLTGGSAQLINNLPDNQKTSLLQELFGRQTGNIGINYIRLSMGASDLDEAVFSYNDLASGETDINLTKFSIQKDQLHLIPILKRILAIQPGIKILATPWSPPVWMKTNTNSVGGQLIPTYYAAYAAYFVKYITAMKNEGITIDAITPQNEPLHGGNNPSLEMSALQQADFIKNHLGPAFAAASITTKIIIYDHNCDRTDYPLSILNDADARKYVNGSAFHLYAGDIGALSVVRQAFTDKSIYFTEQYTASTGDFAGDLRWHIRNVIIGSMRNYSRNALEWNLANDAGFGPHTLGGCTTCKGALTISGTNVTRNVAYYIIAHASAFVPAGSVRITSTQQGNFLSTAFLNPQGKKVLIVLNDNNASGNFNLQFNGKWVTVALESGAVATFVW